MYEANNEKMIRYLEILRVFNKHIANLFLHYFAYLDTVQKALVVELPPAYSPSQQIYYLMEE